MNAIPGFEGYYSATMDGQIFSHHSNNYLTIFKGKRGYMYADLYKNGVRHMRSVHRLIAATFIENPLAKPLSVPLAPIDCQRVQHL